MTQSKSKNPLNEMLTSMQTMKSHSISSSMLDNEIGSFLMSKQTRDSGIYNHSLRGTSNASDMQVALTGGNPKMSLSKKEEKRARRQQRIRRQMGD